MPRSRKPVPNIRIDPSKWIAKRKNFDGKQYTFSSRSKTKTEANKKARRIRKDGNFARVIYHSGLRQWLVYRRNQPGWKWIKRKRDREKRRKK